MKEPSSASFTHWLVLTDLVRWKLCMINKKKRKYINASLQSYTWRTVCDMWFAHQIVSWIMDLRMYKLYFFTNIWYKLLKKNSITQNTFLISQKNVWPIKVKYKFFGSTGFPNFQPITMERCLAVLCILIGWKFGKLALQCVPSSAPKKLWNSVNGPALSYKVTKKIIKHIGKKFLHS